MMDGMGVGAMALLSATLLLVCTASAGAAEGDLSMERVVKGEWRFGGEIGARVDGNIEHWLLRAPDANPGLLEMFRRRDRRLPYAEPVPWAGEFAGKYLISAVQACRMSGDARLKPFVQEFVDQLVATQAEDGYLGPWPKSERLLGHWDLWGHYHCMLGLVMWFDDTGDQRAWDCVLRAADCICDVYAEGDRRPIDAGTPMINLGVLHIMAQLYGRTENPRYLRLIERIEEDLPQDGDWLRKGEAGVPYYKLPGGGTRWESLHLVEGFLERYRQTGEARYKDALVNLWDSIRRYDRHPSGAFSTNEQAFGTVYAPGSIETCCSVAWLALSIDALRLTGDPTVADELELTTWNQALAAQHPSGNWCTYDNPLDGIRAPAYEQISFQYRPGTPELNCCSVNAPRSLGMLSEWAVMEDGAGLVVNFYGPSEVALTQRNGERLTLRQETAYPVEGRVVLTVTPEKASAFALRLRIPAWSRSTEVKVNGETVVAAPGTYIAVNRTWQAGDRVELAFDMAPRYWTGQAPDRVGKAALYVGPVLLSFDAYYNDAETTAIPKIDVANLILEPIPVDRTPRMGYFAPMGLWRVPAEGGANVVLCDFGSAGAHGTDFVSWLPAAHALPGAVDLRLPADNAAGKPGPVLFRWSGYASETDRFELVVARDAGFADIVVRQGGLQTNQAIVAEGLDKEGTYYWKVMSVNENGATENRDGPRSLRVDPAAEQAFLTIRDDGLMAASLLDDDGTPSFGVLDLQEGLTPAADRFGREGGAVAFDGTTSKLRYRLGFFPGDAYTFTGWACPEGLPSKGIQQIFSAWCAGMDDPLRVTLDGEAVFARIEARGCFGTEGVPLENGKWVHVAAVKAGATLTLYVNGQATPAVGAPESIYTSSELIGLGYNPLYSGGELFRGKLDDFAFYARALSAEEVAAAYGAGQEK